MRTKKSEMSGRLDSICIQKMEMQISGFAPLAPHPLLPPRGHYRDRTDGPQNNYRAIGRSSGFAAGRYHQVLPLVLLRACPSSPHLEVALFHPGTLGYVHVGVGVSLP